MSIKLAYQCRRAFLDRRDLLVPERHPDVQPVEPGIVRGKSLRLRDDPLAPGRLLYRLVSEQHRHFDANPAPSHPEDEIRRLTAQQLAGVGQSQFSQETPDLPFLSRLPGSLPPPGIALESGSLGFVRSRESRAQWLSCGTARDATQPRILATTPSSHRNTCGAPGAGRTARRNGQRPGHQRAPQPKLGRCVGSRPPPGAKAL